MKSKTTPSFPYAVPVVNPGAKRGRKTLIETGGKKKRLSVLKDIGCRL